ncbi:MAG: HYR domain-containing protein, partial [Saprospiraceae bacterium]
VVLNPAPENTNFPYYVLGGQWDPGGNATWDDILLLTMSESGALGWKKIYTGPFNSTDDEFGRDLEALPNGDLLFAGNLGTTGVLFRAKNTGELYNGAGPEGLPFSFADVAQAGSSFYAVGNALSGFLAYLFKFDNDLLPVWQIAVPELSAISQVWRDNNGDIYVTGRATTGGLNRGVVLKYQGLGNSPALLWMKYLEQGDMSYTGGASSYLPPGRMAFVDGRVRTAGFGQDCAFMSVSGLDMSTCMTKEGSPSTLTTDLSFNSPLLPNITFFDVPAATNIAQSSALNWQQEVVCSIQPCAVQLQVIPQDSCGLVNVCALPSGPGPYAYQWCSGESSTCITRLAPLCKPVEFCVSVTCSDGTMASAVQTYTATDNKPPVITCPASTTVTATNPDSCTARVNGLKWLSVTDDCGAQVSYSVTGATAITGQGDASGLTVDLGISTIIYTARDSCGNTGTCSFNVSVVCQLLCPGNLVQNAGLSQGLTPGPMPATGKLTNWQAAYGNPEVVADFGCLDPGFVQLSGNKISGDAIFQTLATPIQKGKVYELSICVRVAKKPPSQVPYVKIRAMAFNNSLPTNGNHPKPNPNIALIGVSGKVEVCPDWTQFVFHRWRAGKNYNNIAISIENDLFLGTFSRADLDNICFTEVNDSIPCYFATLDSDGNIVPSIGQLDPNCPPVEEDVYLDMGSVNDVYGYCNPAPDGVDTWYELCADSCESLGGEIPDDLANFIKNDSLNQYMMDSLGVNDSTLMADLGHFQDSLELAYSNVNLLDSMASLGAFAFDCRSLPPQGPAPDDPNSPFKGYDIVFVHGLRTTPLEERLLNSDPLAFTKWPANRNEFYNGYWKRGANAYWYEHTNRYLKTSVNSNFSVNQNGTYTNRYIVVSHPATQSFVFGAHSVMEQIANAMLNGQGVINCSPTEQRPKNTFGHNGFIIISHSDGAPLSDIVLSTSDLTRFPPLNFLLGDVSFIADRCQLHVALQGAFGGSNYASLALMAAAATTPLQFALDLAEPLLGFQAPGPAPWLFTSELLDMSITKKLWGPLMNRVPVCVLTVSGGHPTDFGADGTKYPKLNKVISLIAKHTIQHGFDDGVLCVESQAPNTDSRKNYPNRYYPKLGIATVAGLAAAANTGNPKALQFAALLNERIYDMGIDKSRAVRYYLDQKLDLLVADKLFGQSLPGGFVVDNILGPYSNVVKYLFASSGVIPWLSPSGMVQPVRFARFPGLNAYDALKRYDNHYSFIQSTADHYSGSIGSFGNYPNYEHTNVTGVPNGEESRVVTSNDVYTKCGVSSGMRNLQREYVRGKSKTFTIKIFKFRKTFTFWIWKRKYHLLQDYETKNELDYLYETVLR